MSTSEVSSAAQRSAAVQPRTLLILATGRSGSMFLHSLFDSHPEVISYPAVHGVYSPYFREEHVRAVDDAVAYVKLFSRIGIHFRGGYDEAIGRIGPGGDENFTLDERRFVPLLREELESQGAPTTRRKLVLSIHRAYARLSGVDLGRARLLLDHVHTPSELENALRDFPDAYCLHTIREPAAGYHAMIDLSTRAYGHFKSEFFYKFAKNVFLDPWKELGYPELPFEPGHYRILRLEDLNAGGEHVMRELSEWAGIRYLDVLTQSTIGGKTCHGNSGTAKSVTTFRGRATGGRPGAALSRLEILRIESVLREEMKAQGYEPTTADSTATRLAGLLAIALPLRNELAWNPAAIIRDAAEDARKYPLGGMLRFQLRRRFPRLLRTVEDRGWEADDSLTDRALAASALVGLAGKRVAIDPWYFYLRRIGLFLRHWVRTGPGPAPPPAAPGEGPLRGRSR